MCRAKVAPVLTICRRGPPPRGDHLFQERVIGTSDFIVDRYKTIQVGVGNSRIHPRGILERSHCSLVYYRPRT